MFSIITVALLFVRDQVGDQGRHQINAQTFEMFDICNDKNNGLLFKRGDQKSCFTAHP